MAQDLQNIASLFDYIYLDRQKLAAYAAQFFDDGVLTTLKTSAANSDTNGFNIGAKLYVVEGGGNQSSIVSETLERNYDASWSLPLNVLSALQSNNFIHAGFAGAKIGNLVMTSGRAKLLDVGMLKSMWRVGLNATLSGMPTTTSAHKRARTELKDTWEKIGGIIDNVPRSVQLHLSTDECAVWTTLSQDGMIINPDDLALKYGGKIVGDWHIIGIFDARPEQGEAEEQVEQEEMGLLTGMFGMMDGIRGMVGRPENAYGITPIAIFRKIPT